MVVSGLVVALAPHLESLALPLTLQQHQVRGQVHAKWRCQSQILAGRFEGERKLGHGGGVVVVVVQKRET